MLLLAMRESATPLHRQKWKRAVERSTHKLSQKEMKTSPRGEQKFQQPKSNWAGSPWTVGQPSGWTSRCPSSLKTLSASTLQPRCIQSWWHVRAELGTVFYYKTTVSTPWYTSHLRSHCRRDPLRSISGRRRLGRLSLVWIYYLINDLFAKFDLFVFSRYFSLVSAARRFLS